MDGGGGGVLLNKKWFFRRSDPEQIASNWAHEISHGMGLRHPYEASDGRDQSIPYVINQIFLDVAREE